MTEVVRFERTVLDARWRTDGSPHVILLGLAGDELVNVDPLIVLS